MEHTLKCIWICGSFARIYMPNRNKIGNNTHYNGKLREKNACKNNVWLCSAFGHLYTHQQWILAIVSFSTIDSFQYNQSMLKCLVENWWIFKALAGASEFHSICETNTQNIYLTNKLWVTWKLCMIMFTIAWSVFVVQCFSIKPAIFQQEKQTILHFAS